MYIGTGWANPIGEQGKGNIFVTSDGENFKHIAEAPQTPMVYFIVPASQMEEDLLWGGYVSGGIFRLNTTTGKSKLVLSLPKQSLYSAKIFEGDVYIGTYGKAQVIRYQPVTD